jgi:hypothetical protein
MAANPLKGEVEIVSGDATYTLVFTSNAIVQCEQVLGATIGEITSNLMRVENLRALVWAALQTHHKGADLFKAGDVIDDFAGGMNELADPLARALRFRLSRTALDVPLLEGESAA